MNRRRRRSEPPPDTTAQPSKLSQVRPVVHDEDERQSTADRSTYHSPLKSLFEPVDYPKWMKPRKSKQHL
jgi:hypothetical protein